MREWLDDYTMRIGPDPPTGYKDLRAFGITRAGGQFQVDCGVTYGYCDTLHEAILIRLKAEQSEWVSPDTVPRLLDTLPEVFDIGIH